MTDEIEQIAMASMRSRFAEVDGRAALQALASDVVDGRTDPYAAADLLLSQVSSGTDDSTGWSAGPTTRR